MLQQDLYRYDPLLRLLLRDTNGSHSHEQLTAATVDDLLTDPYHPTHVGCDCSTHCSVCACRVSLQYTLLFVSNDIYGYLDLLVLSKISAQARGPQTDA